MGRPSLAICLITKNEAHNLPALFESFKGCADEIHLTDTGSTDGTVELAKELGATVHHFDWINNFAAARNKSFEAATTDYIMWLDGDDALNDASKFILWRDNVMELADFWMVPYSYSIDEHGKPNCEFLRERVVKRSKGFKWKYFIHEGMTPDTGIQPVKVNLVNTWRVNHRRSAADMAADKSRNLKIFEMHKESELDGRMTYYYGKELFEAGKPLEGFAKLEKSLEMPGLEIHDRILTYQYACLALMQMNQLEKAIEMAHEGLIVDPCRAELQVIIGDCYIKQNKLAEAMGFYHAAKGSVNRTAGGVGPVFTHTDSYNIYPRKQLVKCLANMGQFVPALYEISQINPKDQEASLMEDEIKRISGAGVIDVSNAKWTDDIVFSCAPSPYEWDAVKYKEKAMGGSETACIEMASWLHKLSGRPVKVFNQRATELNCDGVEYIPSSKANEYFSKNKPWVHIAWRHNVKVTEAPTFLWCHDLFTMGAEQIQNYRKHLCLTPFHKRYVMATQGLPEDVIRVTRNGIDPKRFAGDFPKKDPNKVVFTSSPDRGLDRAMLVMDAVRQGFPDAKLHVFYGIEHLEKYGLKDLMNKLKGMMEERPWVVYHGATEQRIMTEHVKEAGVWLHPCDFIETSCITAIEMVLSRTYPVTRKLGGLADTLAEAAATGRATLLEHDCVTQDEFQGYIKATKEALAEHKWELLEKNPFDASKLSWESVAQEWLEFLQSER